MRKKEREIKSRAQIDAVIRKCHVCRLGLTDGREAYIVPLNFGYDSKALYFHCAKEGRKLDLLRKNNRVCFEFDILEGLTKNKHACRWGAHYQSVMGTGTARLIEDAKGKRRGLTLIMKQYSRASFTFPEEAVARTAVIRMEIRTISGKQSRR